MSYPILVNGSAANGKSASMMFLDNQEGVLYLNCEPKPLPFRHRFVEYRISDPDMVPAMFDKLLAVGTIKNPRSGDEVPIHTVVIDTITMLMQLYENKYIKTAKNTQQAWGQYGDYLTSLLHKQSLFTADDREVPIQVVMLSHIVSTEDTDTMIVTSRSGVKGSVGKVIGLEAFFTTVVYAKLVPMKYIEKYREDAKYLNVTEQEVRNKAKHVYVTLPHDGHEGDRIRSPIGMFGSNDLYMDNNIQTLINIQNNFFKSE